MLLLLARQQILCVGITRTVRSFITLLSLKLTDTLRFLGFRSLMPLRVTSSPHFLRPTCSSSDFLP